MSARMVPGLGMGLLAVFLGLASTVASADDLMVSAGLEVGWLPVVHETQNMVDSAGIVFYPGTPFSDDYSYGGIRAGAFFDFTYGRVSIAYRSALSPMGVSVSAGGATASGQSSFSASFLEGRFMGKVPLHIGEVIAAPTAGVEYTWCLAGSGGGASFDTQTVQDYSDLSLVAGLDVDITLDDRWFVRTSALAGYSLTSMRGAPYYAGVAYVSSAGWQLEADLSIGYRFSGRLAATRY